MTNADPQVEWKCQWCNEPVDMDLIGGNSGVRAVLTDGRILLWHTSCGEVEAQ